MPSLTGTTTGVVAGYNAGAMEALLFWMIAAGGAAVLVGRARGTRTFAPALAVAAALAASSVAGAAWWHARDGARRTEDDARARALPSPVADRGYATSDACRACHPSEYASWHRSYHRTMTQAASAATVRAPFAGETLVSGDDGRSYHLRRRATSCGSTSRASARAASA